MPVRLVPHEEPLPGYRLIDRLGRGGFGEVWKVEAPGGLHKAMKFVFGDLDAADEDSRPAEQELKALKRVQGIRHPYVLSLERYDILDGQLIITMELADRNLWDRFRECRGRGLPGIPRDELLSYLGEAAEALDLMNNHYQIQHLDVKPQNLFLVFNHVKVGDFGLAKLMDGVRATVTGGVTPVYAAPETFEGYVSRFSDQYSLAIVFQELLTGTRPFNGTNTRQLLMQHINGTPEMNALPAADRPAVGRALAKRPDDRWPTCSDLVRELRHAGLPFAEAGPTPVNTPHGGRPDESALATRVQGAAGAGGLTPPARHPGLPDVATSTPTPPLVTVGPAGQVVPRLVTPGGSSMGGMGPLTLRRPDIFQTGRMHGHGIAPPEKTGPGVLFPALVVAVGGVGRQVADGFRRAVHDRYGAGRVPNVRFLLIDTDPDAVPAAESADAPDAFAPRDVVLARLHRPAHYLRREALPPPDPWLPPGALYRLPRTPGPADGVRAFGRLALIDNYRAVAGRVRQEVETFLADDPVARADHATGLGLRSNRPRAYVVCGLGGGTGGGMAVDLAYLIRHELRAAGYPRPEVHGLFLVPPADRKAPRTAALGNAHAALAEVHHFQARRSAYRVLFDKGEPPVADPDPPFARVGVVELPKAVDARERAEATAKCARFLFHELLTAAGRATDAARGGLAGSPGTAGGPPASAEERAGRPRSQDEGPHYFTFGLHRLTWPRPEVLAAATRRLARQTLAGWAAKDAGGLRGPVGEWLDGQWAERRLEFKDVLDGLEAAARTALGEEPEAAFDAVLHPLRTRTPAGGRLNAAGGCAALEQLLKMVGKPPCEADEDPGAVAGPLADRCEQVGREAEAHFALMTVTLIERPGFRLAGAEEAVRQIGDRLTRQVDAIEPLRADLDKEVKTLYGRALQVIGGLTGGGPLAALRSAGQVAEALDLMRLYPRKRLQLHTLDAALSLYRKLAGSAPEYLRDIGTCRAGLGELEAGLRDGDGPPPGGGSHSALRIPHSALLGGRLILPDGCATLDDAADRFLGLLPAAELLAFDEAVQREAQRKFRGVAAVCLKVGEKGAVFRELLVAKARAFLDAKLDAADPAAVFFRVRSGTEADHPLIGEVFGEAGPEIAGLGVRGAEEVRLLLAPAGADGDRFRAVAADALPGAELAAVAVADDIAFYREYPRLELAELPHLGEAGRDAARAMAAADHPPHSRADVAWQLPDEV